MKLLYLLIPLLLFSACSNEIGDDIKRGRSTVRIELQQNDPTAVGQNKTRASFGGSYHDAGDDIHNAYVVMYNIKAGKVERIINVPTDAGETEYKSKQVTTITTENGDYLFYNFANRTDFDTDPATPDAATHEVKSLSLDGLTFTVGSPLPEGLDPSPEKLDPKVTTCDYNNYKIPKEGIPMSDKNLFTIDKDQTITLTLYRMLAKMQFAFNNRSKSTIFRIRGLKVGSITDNNTQIYLLPPKNENNLVKTDFTGLQHATTNVDVFTATADKPPVIINSGESDNTSFNNLYINESEASTKGQSFPLTITMDRSTDNGVTWEDDSRHALIQLTSIPRNNVAIVNVNLTDFVLKLEASAYAPIGGYPAYVVKQNDDFYAYFSGSGDFELRPTLYEYIDREHPERYINLNDKSRVTNYSLTVLDPQGIFSSQPAFDTTTGEILGTLAEGRTGTATVRLNLQLVIGSATQSYTRTIYIVRN